MGQIMLEEKNYWLVFELLVNNLYIMFVNQLLLLDKLWL